MMNEGQFMALRAEASETNGLLKQVLEEQKRANQLLEAMAGYEKVNQLRLTKEINEAVKQRMAQAVKSKQEEEGALTFAAPGAFSVSTPKQQLEAETGHEVVQTSDDPPTFVETGKRAKSAGAPKGKGK